MVDLGIFEEEDDSWESDLEEDARYCVDCGEKEANCLCDDNEYH